MSLIDGYSVATLKDLLGVLALEQAAAAEAGGGGARSEGSLAMPLIFSFTDGLLTGVQDKDAETVTIVYDAQDRVSTVSNTLTSLVNTLTYDVDGNLYQITEAPL